MDLVTSPAYRPEFELAVQAMQLAAATQYEQGGSQRTAGALALAVVSIFGVTVLAPALRRGAAFPAPPPPLLLDPRAPPRPPAPPVRGGPRVGGMPTNQFDPTKGVGGPPVAPESTP